MRSSSHGPQPKIKKSKIAGWMRFSGSRRLDDSPISHWTWAVDVGLAGQFHHGVGFPLPGGAKEAFADLYGQNRLRTDLGAHKVLWKSVAVRAWVRTDFFDPPSPRFAGAAGYTLESELFLQRVKGLQTWPGWIDWFPPFIGLGIRYARGQDYYNTQFVRDIDHLQFLFVVEPWSPFAER